ncbi:hypothetical protein ACJX0J_022170, partial [Zea mays]
AVVRNNGGLVKEAKAIIRLFPIWAACLLYAVAYSQSSTFFTKQASTLDRWIRRHVQVPPAALQSFISVTIVVIIPIYDRVLVPVLRQTIRDHHAAVHRHGDVPLALVHGDRGARRESELRSGGRHMEALPFLRESHSMLPRRPTIYPGTKMALVQEIRGRWTHSTPRRRAQAGLRTAATISLLGDFIATAGVARPFHLGVATLLGLGTGGLRGCEGDTEVDWSREGHRHAGLVDVLVVGLSTSGKRGAVKADQSRGGSGTAGEVWDWVQP